MKFNLLVLLLSCMCYFAHSAHAANPDILWQKTLTADTLPIRSIAIFEGKYVAALKGNQIIILDYATGDSIKSFTAPKEMYGNDIILGKGGERLYVLVRDTLNTFRSTLYLRSWDISKHQLLSDLIVSAKPTSTQNSYYYVNYSISSSLNGNIISIGTTYEGGYGSSLGSGGIIRAFNTLDSTFNDSLSDYSGNRIPPIIKNTSTFPPKPLGYKGGGIYYVTASHSGNYLLANLKFYTEGSGGGYTSKSTIVYGNIIGLSSNYPTYAYSDFVPPYTFSHDDDFLLLGNQLYDLPPTRVLRSITKTGFAFLPDDNHLLAFKAGGGVAAISNIERDTWEKVFYGDSLTENLIQPGAKFVSFATATNARITLWKIPDTLQAATLSVDFTMTKDTISLGDTVSFSNKTYPFKRGNMYQWHFGDSLASSAEIHPKHVFAQKGNYTILLQVRDTLGRISSISKSITVQNPTDVLEANPLHATALSISPNPSYTETQIHITLAQASNYNVRIMDNLGREIARWEEHSSTGEHVILWNENVPSGVYYCTLSVGGEVRMVPFVVVR